MSAFVKRVSDLMGLSESQTGVFLGVFALAAALGLWFAISSAVMFYRGFQSGGIIQPSGRDALIVDDFNSRVVVVEVDEIVPPGYYTDTGQLVLCGSHLIGDNVRRYGWVWDADENGDEGDGVCRRLATR